MTTTHPFSPHYGSNKQLSATDVPQTTTISNHNETVRILNAGPGLAFVRVGEGAQNVAVGDRAAVSAADFPIAAGMSSTFRKPIGNNGSNGLQLGYVCAAGVTASLHVMTGNGGV